MQCSYAFETKTLFFIFGVLTKGSIIEFLACRAADCMFQTRNLKKKKEIFSALLMINVLIFLDMVWFGF